MAIPFPVLLTIPIPFVLLLVLLICYHLTPLLTLLPHLTPSLSKLANLIPHPRRPRNLPREFFNLPPRPEDDASSINGLHVGSVLGVRGKLMLLLLAQTTVSIACGWAFLMVGGTNYTSGTAILLAISILPLPSTVATLAVFTACPHRPSQRHYSVDSLLRRKLLRGGGITHDTLFARILPFSLIPVTLGFSVAAAMPQYAGLIVLGISGAMVASTLALAVASQFRTRRHLAQGAIRLRSSSPGVTSGQSDNTGELIEKDIEDWVTSPGRPDYDVIYLHQSQLIIRQCIDAHVRILLLAVCRYAALQVQKGKVRDGKRLAHVMALLAHRDSFNLARMEILARRHHCHARFGHHAGTISLP